MLRLTRDLQNTNEVCLHFLAPRSVNVVSKIGGRCNPICRSAVLHLNSRSCFPKSLDGSDLCVLGSAAWFFYIVSVRAAKLYSHVHTLLFFLVKYESYILNTESDCLRGCLNTEWRFYWKYLTQACAAGGSQGSPEPIVNFWIFFRTLCYGHIKYKVVKIMPNVNFLNDLALMIDILEEISVLSNTLNLRSTALQRNLQTSEKHN
jgi:hypothetical protein